MSRPIRFNETETNNIVNLLRSNLKNGLFYGQDKLNLSLPIPEDKARAKLNFSAIAWSKMHWLVQEFKDEIEWHGLIVRTDKRSFYVKDILTFPHEISPSSVISDQKEYADWINGLPHQQQQELFFHGHSHVNYTVSPSPVDTKYRSDIIGNLGIPRPGTDEDIFYAFIILNKRSDWSAQIFDVTNNVVYDTKDIDLDILCEDGTKLSDFLTSTKSIVKEKRPTPYDYRGNIYPQFENATQSRPLHDKTTIKKREAKKK